MGGLDPPIHPSDKLAFPLHAWQKRARMFLKA